MRDWLGTAARRVVGLVLGVVTTLVEVPVLVLVGLGAHALWPWRSTRHRAPALAGRVVAAVTDLELRRIAACFGGAVAAERRGTGRDARYLLARLPLGLLSAALIALLVYGAGTGLVALGAWLRGRSIDGVEPNVFNVVYLVLAGAVLAFLEWQGIRGTASLERTLAERMLGPSRTAALEGRVAELSASRAGIVAAVDAERRRIERDLHDGVQQRVVALAMLLGRARRAADAGMSDRLLAQAHDGARDLLAELREVAWRVYPAALDSLGLQDALAGVAERSPVPVTLRFTLSAAPPPPVQTAIYFIVSEAVTNAAKHVRASSIIVDVTDDEGTAIVEVRDNGDGGARPSGGGLSGLARRVAAIDGVFGVDSPPGGPTVIRAELPCG